MKISQREARRLRKRVTELEAAETKRRRTWSQEWPGGVQIAATSPTESVLTAIRTARKLGHAVVATVDGDNDTFVRFTALRHPDSGI
jgi:hypothetical protein